MQNATNIVEKTIKIVPKWCQDGTKIEPKWEQDGAENKKKNGNTEGKHLLARSVGRVILEGKKTSR